MFTILFIAHCTADPILKPLQQNRQYLFFLQMVLFPQIPKYGRFQLVNFLLEGFVLKNQFLLVDSKLLCGEQQQEPSNSTEVG